MYVLTILLFFMAQTAPVYAQLNLSDYEKSTMHTLMACGLQGKARISSEGEPNSRVFVIEKLPKVLTCQNKQWIMFADEATYSAVRSLYLEGVELAIDLELRPANLGSFLSKRDLSRREFVMPMLKDTLIILTRKTDLAVLDHEIQHREDAGLQVPRRVNNGLRQLIPSEVERDTLVQFVAEARGYIRTKRRIERSDFKLYRTGRDGNFRRAKFQNHSKWMSHLSYMYNFKVLYMQPAIDVLTRVKSADASKYKRIWNVLSGFLRPEELKELGFFKHSNIAHADVRCEAELSAREYLRPQGDYYEN